MSDKFTEQINLRVNKTLLKQCEKRVKQLNEEYQQEFHFTMQSYIRRLIYEDMRK